MSKSYLEWGNWNAICDRCGFKFKASELRKDWQGLMVDEKCFEQRHPQDYLRVRGDNPSVPWSRPEADDVFTGPACYIWDQSCYAGLAIAGCAKAGYKPFSSTDLYALKFPTVG